MGILLDRCWQHSRSLTIVRTDRLLLATHLSRDISPTNGLAAFAPAVPDGDRALFDPPPVWLYFSFTIGTYLLTALLIYVERERLQAFWFDLASAIIFLCQKFLFLGGIGLFAAMRGKRARFPTPPPGVLRWALLGGLLGVLAELLLVYLKVNPPQERSTELASLWFLVPAVFTPDDPRRGV